VRIIFRADASTSVGTGHVMRCIAIMEEALSRSVECIFVGSLGGIQWLEQKFMELDVRQYADFGHFNSDNKRDVLVLDSYSIPIFDENIQPTHWKTVVAIADDSTPNYNASLVVKVGLQKFECEELESILIGGPKYVPFRKSIKKIPFKSSDQISKILVFAGGADRYNFAGCMAKGLSNMAGFSEAVFFTNSKDSFPKLDSRFRLKQFSTEIDAELEDSDLVFTTASMSSLEIVARELPLGVCCTTDNQISYYQDLTSQNVAVGIGTLIEHKIWNLEWSKIRDLVIDTRIRSNLVSNMKDFFDLQGSSRIVDKILAGI
jgi:spore coat polysaccharide biosynthesis predicted glycosyltransferase SpsG